MLGLVPVAIASLAGYFVVRLLSPTRGLCPAWAVFLFNASLGGGFGVGLFSLLMIGLTVAGWASARTLLAVDVATLCFLGAGVYWRQRRRHPQSKTPPKTAPRLAFTYNWLLTSILGLSLMAVLAGMFSQVSANPHGMWDAWAIWNLRARFLAGPGESWRNAVSPLLEKTHPDYPLLLSGFVAHGWKVGSNFHPIVPITTAVVFFLSCVGLLTSAVALLRGTTMALLAGLVVMTGYTFLEQPMTQYSDVPLAFYYLAALTLVHLASSAQEPQRRTLVFLAGAAAGLAAWTKNEGLLFLAVFSVCFILVELFFSGPRTALRGAFWLFWGLLPGLLLTWWLKFTLAPTADPVVKAGVRGIARSVARAERLRRVLNAISQNFLNFGFGPIHPVLTLVVLAAALRFRCRRALLPPVLISGATLVLVFMGYVAISMSTPTQFSRFYTQLFPSLLLVFFLALRPLEELLEQPAPAPRAASEPSTKRTKKKRS